MEPVTLLVTQHTVVVVQSMLLPTHRYASLGLTILDLTQHSLVVVQFMGQTIQY